MARTALIFSSLSMALLTGACGDADDGRPRITTTTRLSELLDVATIDSPLQRLPAARTLADLGQVGRTEILKENFDGGKQPWGNGPRSTIEPRKRGDLAFNLQALTWQGYRGWIVPVEPNTHYVFQRTVKTNVPLRADFAVVEEKVQRGNPKQPDGGVGITRGRTLRVHWAELPTPDGTWQRGAVSFYTTARTRAIGIELRLNHNVKVEPGKVDIWFDDFRLERVDATPDQAISLLKARALAEGADPDLGIHKHGKFLPQSELPEEGYDPVHHNFDHRYALYAPPTTELAFPVVIERDARLLFSVALARESQPGSSARFEIWAREGDTTQELWATQIAANEDWRWHEIEVDLTPIKGRPVELLLRTHATGGTPHCLWGHPTIDVAPTPGEVRNVILIAVDTLRADRMSCYGYGKKTSPHLDTFAQDGTRFDQVASNATWTCPSFASILTGLVPSRHGVWRWGPSMPLPAHVDTIAERFREEGWATYGIAYKTPLYNGGYDQGFDVSFNAPMYGPVADDNLKVAMQWLEANEDRRNFLFLHFDDPHQPFNQPEPWDSKFGRPASSLNVKGNLTPRKAGRIEGGREVMSGLYDGEIAYVDDAIGRFLAVLKQKGLYDDAVIGFVADHGEGLWENGVFGHSDAKMWDTVTRVPLIVKPPRGAGEDPFARGKVVRSQVQGFDVMPTLLDLAGIDPGEAVDALSLVPMLGPGETEATDRVAVIEATDAGSIAARDGRWKYHLTYTGQNGPVEKLFDIRSDPTEQKDVAGDRADALERMRVATLDYVMTKRAGSYLVLIGDDAATPAPHVLGGAFAFTPMVGKRPERARAEQGSVASFSPAEPRDEPRRLVAAGTIRIVGPITLADGSELEPRRYRPGELQELLTEGASGAHLFDGPPRMQLLEESMNTVDVEMLEQMKRLGYAGGDK